MGTYEGQGAKAYTVGADGQVVTGKGRLIAVTLNNGATAGGVAILYDNTAASGTKLATVGSAANDTAIVSFGSEGVEFVNGVFADWTSGVLHVYIKQ